MLPRLLRDLVLACLIFLLTGCLINSSSKVDESGKRVGDNTLRQIQPGQTSEDWLLATLGEPTSRSPVRGPGDTEILAYSHERIKKSHGSMFLLFSGSSKSVDRRCTYFEVSDGVVQRYWTDS